MSVASFAGSVRLARATEDESEALRPLAANEEKIKQRNRTRKCTYLFGYLSLNAQSGQMRAPFTNLLSFITPSWPKKIIIFVVSPPKTLPLALL